MKIKFTKYILLVAFMILMSGCSTAALVEASNGKTYYVDTALCETYKLNNDKMYCYIEGSKCDTTVYKPVTSGCASQVFGNSYHISK